MKESEFNLDEAVGILERTPASLKAMLEGLPETWIQAKEGEIRNGRREFKDWSATVSVANVEQARTLALQSGSG